MARKRSRLFLTLGTVAIVGGAFAFAFWPKPVMVDMGEVTRGRMIVTIDEEARTRVHDAYVVSTPIAGRLLRVEVEPGAHVERGSSVVAQMLPTNPAALDIRSREQARAAVNAAEAALRVARADLNKAMADRDMAVSAYTRTKQLRSKNIESQAALERDARTARAAIATLDSAEAAISMREAEVANARAQLIGMDDQGLAHAIGGGRRDREIPVYSPSSGRVLRVIQKSETTLPAGAPIMEIGNVENDLEVTVELLSTDAVQVSPGNKVFIDDWGGSTTLEGVVDRIDPWGFTKVSALGVEEQRVNAVIRFTAPPEARGRLGHGFRVEVRIVVWEDADALIVPSSALFRDGDSWAVFTVSEGKAQQSRIGVGRNNGIEAQVLENLEAGDRVVLYPSSALTDGVLVEQRQLD